MTLNDLIARFKAIYSINAAKMTKYSLLMTRLHVERLDALYLLGLRIHEMVHLLTYLLTYTVGSGSIEPAISQKRLKIERKLLLTALHGLSTAPKCMTLNDCCTRFKFIDCLNAAKMVKYGLVMTPTECRVTGCMISVRQALMHLHSWLGHIKPAISLKRLKIE